MFVHSRFANTQETQKLREQIERGESRRRREELEQSNRAEEALQLLKMRREIGALVEDVQRVAYSEVCALKMRPFSTFQYASSRHFDYACSSRPEAPFCRISGHNAWTRGVGKGTGSTQRAANQSHGEKGFEV